MRPRKHIKLFCPAIILICGLLLVFSGCCGGFRRRQNNPPPASGRSERARFFVVVISDEKPLERLAVAYLVDVEELAALNRLSVDAVLSPGDRILIPPNDL